VDSKLRPANEFNDPVKASSRVICILRRKARMESEISDAEADRLENGRKFGVERTVYKD